MLAKVLLPLAALTSLATAFTIPLGATSGNYRAYIDAAGNEVHELVTKDLAPVPAASARTIPAPSSPANVHNPLTKRSTYWCGCNFPVTHADCDAATAGLYNQLGSGQWIDPGVAWYTISNTVVTFACSRDSEPQFWVGQQVTDYSADITNACGFYIAGTYEPSGIKGDILFGRMQYTNGLDFCANSDGATGINHC